MRFFNKNFVFVLFLFIVSCSDGFNAKAHKKSKEQKPNQVQIKQDTQQTKDPEKQIKRLQEENNKNK